MRQGLPLCWESGFPNSDGGGKADGDGVLAGLWAVVRVRRCLGAGVTCCRSLRSGTLSSGTVRGSGDGGGGEIFGAGFAILRGWGVRRRESEERERGFDLVNTSFPCT